MFKVFIANLGKYNEGELVGKWLSLPCDDIAAELADIGVKSGTLYEEYFIADYNNDFGIEVGEYASLARLNDIAEQLEELDEYEAAHLAAYIEATGDSAEKALEEYENTAYYDGMTLEEVAEDLFDDYPLPENLRCYIDIAAFARDLSFEGYTETSNGVICLY